MGPWVRVGDKQFRVLSRTTPTAIADGFKANNSRVMPSNAHHRPESPYFTAELFIAQYGDSAITHAEKEMNDCQASGDGDGYMAWGWISDAITELQDWRSAAEIAGKLSARR